jgi:hypothetical protein
MLAALRRWWRWWACGWPVLRPHELYFERVLIMIAEVRCYHCDGRWLTHRDGGLLPWPADGDEFFERRLKEMKRDG